MLSLWVDPAGKLWEIDYSGTQDFMLNDTMDKPWNAFKQFLMETMVKYVHIC